MICSFVVSGESMLKELVSDEDAAGVICLLYTTSGHKNFFAKKMKENESL